MTKAIWNQISGTLSIYNFGAILHYLFCCYGKPSVTLLIALFLSYVHNIPHVVLCLYKCIISVKLPALANL